MADNKETFDLIVIGGGPGGYVAAIRARQLGMRVALVEKRKTLGGTCLNVGCIPSKALLHSSAEYAGLVGGGVANLGIKIAKPKLDIKKMLAHKDKVVSGLTDGIALLMRKNKITHIEGSGRISAANVVAVGDKEIRGARILIATGSASQDLKGVAVDEKRIVSSTGALDLPQVPKRMLVIGGGYIGLEMASIWGRLGAQVEVVEFLPRLMPGMDGEVATKTKSILEKQGINFRLNTAVQSAQSSASNVASGVAVEMLSDGKVTKTKCDVVLVAIGRRPYFDGLGVEALGIATDDKGRIAVNARFESSVAGIYAIGDVIAGPMLAHKAEEDGVAAVELMAGLGGHVDYDLVPGIVYTDPEIATIGKNEEQLNEAGIAFNKGVFPLLANSRARTSGSEEGFVKILADAKTDRVLGVHIIGADAGTLIHEAAAVLAFGGAAEDIARICHGHPTLNEAVKEAALAVDGRAIHI